MRRKSTSYLKSSLNFTCIGLYKQLLAFIIIHIKLPPIENQLEYSMLVYKNSK